MAPWRTLDDVARLTGVSRRTLQRWLQRGLITAYRIEGDRRRWLDLAEVRSLQQPRRVSRRRRL